MAETIEFSYFLWLTVTFYGFPCICESVTAAFLASFCVWLLWVLTMLFISWEIGCSWFLHVIDRFFFRIIYKVRWSYCIYIFSRELSKLWQCEHCCFIFLFLSSFSLVISFFVVHHWKSSSVHALILGYTKSTNILQKLPMISCLLIDRYIYSYPYLDNTIKFQYIHTNKY